MKDGQLDALIRGLSRAAGRAEGEPSETCERCGTSIRYVYTISHQDWGVLDVGEQCCDRLTSEIDASGHLRFWKSAEERKARLLDSPLWKRVGGSLCRRYREFYCEIQPDGEGHRITLTLPDHGSAKRRDLFASEDEARAWLFDNIETGELQRIFAKRFPRSE